MSESSLTRRVCDGWKQLNGIALSFTGSQYQRPGIADRFLAHRRVPGGAWVEFKLGANAQSAAQRILARQLTERGCLCVVARHPSNDKIGAIEDWDGRPLAEWDGSALGLLTALEAIP